MNTQNYTSTTDIRLSTKLYYGLPAIITNDGVSTDDNGRKIIKAGTPVGGVTSFLDDETAKLSLYTAPAASSSDSGSGSGSTSTTTTPTVQGIVLHDTDVTAGDTSTTVMILGIVGLKMVDDETQALLTADIQAALPHILFPNR